MAVTTAAVVVAAGATVAASQAQKKGAQQAGEAFKNVGTGIQKMDRIEASMRQLLGGDRKAGGDNDRYKILQDKSYEIVSDQMNGRVSQSTRDLLQRRSLSSGAVGLGRTAVDDLFTGYLGLTQEGLVQQGFANYRAMFGQLASVAQQQQAQTYNMQYNAAAQEANAIMGKANAEAGMWQGLASIAGGFIGGGMGGMAGGASAGGGGGGMFGAGTMAGGGAQPSAAYYTSMAQAGRNPNIGGAYLGI